MFRKSTRPARRLSSHVALAFALATGGMVGSAFVATPALAQKKKEDDKGKAVNSKGFADAYGPLSEAVNAGTDYAAAKGMVPGVVAAIENNHDKFVMGSLLVTLGDKSKDTALQEQGIQLMLDSGETPPERLGMFHYYLGKWAMDAKNYPKARTEFQASAAAGYPEGDPEVIMAETYFGEKNYNEGLRYLSALIDKRKAAGQQIPDAWINRGLAIAYEGKLADQGNNYASRLLAQNPSNENWLKAFTVVATLNRFDEQGQLDLLRLMALTNALKERNQYQEYLNTTTRLGLPNEALSVLNYGVAHNAFTSSDPLYTGTKGVIDPLIARDAKDIPNLAKDAQAAATGRDANGAGNAFYSLGRYADAEAMFKLALDKGGVDVDTVRTRLGMAQIQQGNLAGGKATLEQVNGARAPVADMWIAYANSKGATGA